MDPFKKVNDQIKTVHFEPESFILIERKISFKKLCPKT